LPTAVGPVRSIFKKFYAMLIYIRVKKAPS